MAYSTTAAWKLAMMSNFCVRHQVAKRAPGLQRFWTRVTAPTGRGQHDGERSVDYFMGVANDYESMAALTGVRDHASVFAQKHVLELGPGDTLAIGLLAQARGARSFEVLDPETYLSERAYGVGIYRKLMQRERQTLSDAELGARLKGIARHASLTSLEAAGKRFDLVISRAVLEHVGQLPELFRALARVVKSDGVLIHKVDLRCHGYKWRHELDFLSFPSPHYERWTANLGLPNRVRIGRYVELAHASGLPAIQAYATHVLPVSEVQLIRPRLSAAFRALPVHELGVLGMWLVQVGVQHPRAQEGLRELSFQNKLQEAPHELLAAF